MSVRRADPEAGLRLLTLDRPERRNALDRATYAGLAAAFEEAGRDASVRAVVLAGAGARFRLPFTALGLSPEGGSSYLLPLVAGSKRAAELLMRGQAFGAPEVVAAGLVNAAVPEGAALASALAKARTPAALPPASIAATKRALRRGQDEAVARALREAAEVFHALRRGPGAQAAFAAFLRR